MNAEIKEEGSLVLILSNRDQKKEVIAKKTEEIVKRTRELDANWVKHQKSNE